MYSCLWEKNIIYCIPYIAVVGTFRLILCDFYKLWKRSNAQVKNKSK